MVQLCLSPAVVAQRGVYPCTGRVYHGGDDVNGLDSGEG